MPYSYQQICSGKIILIAQPSFDISLNYLVSIHCTSDDDSKAIRVTSKSIYISSFISIASLSCSFIKEYQNQLRKYIYIYTMTTEYRIESDTFGDLKVPANVYWGAQTQR